jgi:hypothetical protein
VSIEMSFELDNPAEAVALDEVQGGEEVRIPPPVCKD